MEPLQKQDASTGNGSGINIGGHLGTDAFSDLVTFQCLSKPIILVYFGQEAAAAGKERKRGKIGAK
jgi:hypothetical protein